MNAPAATFPRCHAPTVCKKAQTRGRVFRTRAGSLSLDGFENGTGASLARPKSARISGAEGCGSKETKPVPLGAVKTL